MTQEEKDLLIQDLCARLSHGVKIQGINPDNEVVIEELFSIGVGEVIDCNMITLSDVKPYLFPLSSMTAEQLYELRELFGFEIEFLNGFIELSSRNTLEYSEMVAIIEWFNKNHFDYRDLIPMGLAIDCTNLNIY